MYSYESTFVPSSQSGELLPLLDPDSVPKSLRHCTRIAGTTNGEFFELKGGGEGNPHEGVLSCRLVSNTGTVPFPMPLMNVIAIFGYPTYSRHVNVFDIFKRSDGYEYERHIEFENGGAMHSLHVVRYGENDDIRFLNGDFSVDGNFEVPADICGLSPILETFIPAGKGRVRSKFLLSWVRKNGSRFLANCESEYRLRHDLELSEMLFRHAEFVADRSTPFILDLDERIWVTNRFAQDEIAA